MQILPGCQENNTCKDRTDHRSERERKEFSARRMDTEDLLLPRNQMERQNHEITDRNNKKFCL